MFCALDPSNLVLHSDEEFPIAEDVNAVIPSTNMVNDHDDVSTGSAMEEELVDEMIDTTSLGQTHDPANPDKPSSQDAEASHCQ